MSGKIKIGEMLVKKGTKSLGFLDVAETAGTIIKMPVVVINGSKLGPMLCVSGGVHGCEYSSVEAVIRLTKKLNPKDVSGAVIAVPVVNIPSFSARTAFVNPFDNKNVNRVFPGEPDGTSSHQIAHKLFKEVVSKSSYYIDCHGGDITEDVTPMLWLPKPSDEKMKETLMNLAACFDTKWLAWDTGGAGSASFEAFFKLGVPALTTEAGKGIILQEDAVKFHLDGIINVMKYLKMIKGTPSIRKDQIVGETYYVKTKRGGIFLPKLKLGDSVKAGEVVAEITDVFGETIETIKASEAGVAYMSGAPYAVNAGEVLLGIVKTK